MLENLYGLFASLEKTYIYENFVTSKYSIRISPIRNKHSYIKIKREDGLSVFAFTSNHRPQNLLKNTRAKKNTIPNHRSITEKPKFNNIIPNNKHIAQNRTNHSINPRPRGHITPAASQSSPTPNKHPNNTHTSHNADHDRNRELFNLR